MKDALYEKAIKTYINTLRAHIRLLTLNGPSHQASEERYTGLFDTVHLLGESDEAGGYKTSDEENYNVILNNVYDENRLLRDKIKDKIDKVDDPGDRKLLEDLYQDAKLRCGKIKSYIDEDDNSNGPTETDILQKVQEMHGPLSE